MIAGAVALLSLNATVAKVVVDSGGLSPLRLAELRAVGGATVLVGVLVLLRPRALLVSRDEVRFLASFGIALAFVHFFYFTAITRLDIGIALVIQYLAPLLIAIWARFWLHERIRRRLWIALSLSLVGLSVVVDFRGDGELDGLGIAAALGGAVAFAAYILMANHGLEQRDTYSLLAWGFIFATLFWTVAQPWWTFPVESMANDPSLHGRFENLHLPMWVLVIFIVVLGTVVPWLLEIGALRHLSPISVTTVAMAEPVVASAVAFVWLNEAIRHEQIVGGFVVLAGIALAQTARTRH
jgi:drug/metabolite transporter (DMT)-like permease